MLPKAKDPKEARQRTRQYLAALPPVPRRALKALAAAIRAAKPAAEEAFSYGIPGFRLDGKPFLWYAAFKEHTSLYPLGAGIHKRFASELEGCGFSTGTIRFPFDRQPSPALVKKLVRARAAEMRSKSTDPR